MRRASVVLALFAAGAIPACREATRALTPPPSGAERAAAFFEALAGRFGPVAREPSFDAARPRLARAALVPSRVFDAEDLWTSREEQTRLLGFAGTVQGSAYRIGLRAVPPAPARPGDYRAFVGLRRTAKGRFEWAVREELALGPLSPQDVARALAALLRHAEVTPPDEIRRDALIAFPRATTAISRLLRLQALELDRQTAGQTGIRLALRVHPAGVRSFAPRYAAFLDKYMKPLEVRVVARGPSGAPFWALEGREHLWTLSLRVEKGRLVPLEGASRDTLPGLLRVTTDYSTRVGLFRIGARGLHADVTLIRTPGEKALLARFVQEPDWRLPFLIEPFLRGSLRYPFEEKGSSLALGILEHPAGSTVFHGDYTLRVRESWVIRWLGGLASDAVSEFRKGAEAEADRFNRECLLAVRDDLVAFASE